jgi:hypothetical protein
VCFRQLLKSHLGGGKFLRVTKYRQARQPMIEMESCRSNQQQQQQQMTFPTKTLVSLNLEVYTNLRQCLGEVASTLEHVCNDKDAHFKKHLGKNIYVSVDAPYRGVSLRRWFLKPGDVNMDLKLPGKGVFLNSHEFDRLQTIDREIIDRIIPELKSVTSCLDNHQGQMSYLKCPFCNPDSYLNW